MDKDRIVAIALENEHFDYPKVPPFLPDENYQEFGVKIGFGNEKNIVYKLVREVFMQLGFDKENYSSENWNPLGKLIKPGDAVLLKPNLVRHVHLGGGDYKAVVTHASLIRCIADYVALALKGKGEITIGDAPLQSTDFEEVLKKTSLRDICDDLSKKWKIPVKLVDFRLWKISISENHQFIEGSNLKGDIRGYGRVDMGQHSCLLPISRSYEKYRVTFYDPSEMKAHHNMTTNEYIIPKTVLDADVIINLPKLKTHRKVGITAALKNLVGINGHKDWLPHHRKGSVSDEGDEYKERSWLKEIQTNLDEQIHKNHNSSLNKSRLFLIKLAAFSNKLLSGETYYEGSWYGNDTLWRTVLDLNRLLIYADKNGNLGRIPQRRCFTVVDAIVAGEGEGPMEPDPRPLGMLIGGYNPVSVDAVIATIIGFDYKKIPLIKNGFEIKDLPLVDFAPDKIQIKSNDNKFLNCKVGDPINEYCFVPPAGWIGHIENKI